MRCPFCNKTSGFEPIDRKHYKCTCSTVFEKEVAKKPYKYSVGDTNDWEA